MMAPRPARKQKGSEALKRCDNDPHVVAAVAQLFQVGPHVWCHTMHQRCLHSSSWVLPCRHGSISAADTDIFQCCRHM